MRRLTLLVLLALPTAMSAQAPQADTLAAEAKALFKKGRFAASDSLYVQALELKRQTAAEDSPEYIAILCDYIKLCLEFDKLDGLSQKIERVMEVRAEHPGKNSPEYADILGHQGRYLIYTFKFAEAEAVITESLRIRREHFGEESSPYAYALIDLATACVYKQEFARAETYGTQSSQIAARIGDRLTQALADTNMATLYAYTARIPKAIECFPPALEMLKAEIGEKHLSYVIPFSNYASILTVGGDFRLAEPQLEQALQLATEVLGKEHRQYLTTLTALVNTYIARGKYEQAEKLIVESIAISKKRYGDNDPRLAYALQNLSNVCLNLGDYTRAEEAIREAIDIASKTPGAFNRMKASLLNSQGVVYLRQMRFADATKLFSEALEAQKEANLLDNHVSLVITINLTTALLELENPDLSQIEKTLLTVLEKYRNNSTQTPAYLTALTNTAALYRKAGQYDRALAQIDEAVTRHEKLHGTDNWQYINILGHRGEILQSAGRIEDAINCYANCLKQITKLAARDFLFLSEQEREQYWKMYNVRIKHYQNAAVTASPSAAGLAYNCELFAKSLLLSSSVTKQNAVYRSGDEQLIALWKQMKSLRATSRSDEAQALERELLGRLKEAGAGDEFTTDWRSIRTMLSPGEAAVELINVPIMQEDGTIVTHYYALILRADSEAPELIALCPEQQLQLLLGKANKPSDELRGMVWDPLEPALESVQTIYLSPSGTLNAVAFAALPDKKGYLADRYTIHNLLSTRDIAVLKSTESPFEHRNLVLFGGADFGLSIKQLDNAPAADESALMRGTIDRLHKQRGQGFDYLPGSLTEVKSIGRIASSAKWNVALFTDNRATEARLKSYSGASPEVLHISTHGFYFDPSTQDSVVATEKPGNEFKHSVQPMMRSGLLFSGANNIWNSTSPANADNDGVLTAYEIANLDFSNTKLVVLSACNTGLGDIDYSEGVYGLQRALRLAGVRAMIVSLWRVPDKETTLLMTEFYRHLTSGHAIARAFSLAQLALRERYPTEPEKWGAFVLVE